MQMKSHPHQVLPGKIQQRLSVWVKQKMHEIARILLPCQSVLCLTRIMFFFCVGLLFISSSSTLMNRQCLKYRRMHRFPRLPPEANMNQVLKRKATGRLHIEVRVVWIGSYANRTDVLFDHCL